MAVRRMVRDPLFLFLLIGGACFLAYALVTRAADRIEVTRTMQTGLAGEYEAMTGRRPTPAQQAKLVQEYVANEVLFREAIARGMHLTDKATKQRLIDQLRYMITGAPAEPAEADLIDYYASHLELYRSEPQTTFAHVFFAEQPADPAAVLARLNRGEVVKGDDFWMGRAFPDYGRSMVRGMFGQTFLVALEKAPAGRWVGPVPSSRGVHFIRVEGHRAPAVMPYTEIRDQVRQDYTAARAGNRIDAEVAKLEQNYVVAIDR